MNFIGKINDAVWVTNLSVKGIVKELEDGKYKVTYFDNEIRKTEWFEENEISEFKSNNKQYNKKPYKKDIIYFAKTNPNAIIPSKRPEDGCYDLYPCFDEDYIEIQPGEIKMIPTGIASASPFKYRFEIRERGSSGTKGLSRRSGQVDAGYRNEWFVPINNTTNKTIYIYKEGIIVPTQFENIILYDYKKAIAQIALEIVPNVDVQEISYEELQKIPSERGLGNLGSSGK